MLKSRLSGLFLLLCLLTSPVFAQRQTDLVINEVLTLNKNNYMDRFGDRAGWIEIYNNSEGTVSLAGCYLTDDLTQLKKYAFVKGDHGMFVGPHQRVIIYCNNNPARSAFHTNFSLKAGKENVLALVSPNGIDIIDQVKVPALAIDQSWGASHDGEKEGRMILAQATPRSANYIENITPSAEIFKAKDPYGFGMALTAMSVVFCALLLLYLSFKVIGKIAIRMANFRARKAQGLPKGTVVETVSTSGEVYAAIAMALSLHDENLHDEEDTILTMRSIERRYSPWSSKLYGLRETPQKRK